MMMMMIPYDTDTDTTYCMLHLFGVLLWWGLGLLIRRSYFILWLWPLWPLAVGIK
jgi:hypothetical protein